MKDYIQRNKQERLRNKIRRTPEFKAFEAEYLYTCKRAPSSWINRMIFKYLPATQLGQWRMKKRTQRICKLMGLNEAYFLTMLKYL